MVASRLSKYKTILYDEKGRPVMAQLDLRNKLMRRAFEKAMEELEDELDVKEAMARDDGQGIPWEEVRANFLYEKGPLAK